MAYVVDYAISAADGLLERGNLVCAGKVLDGAHGDSGVGSEEGYEIRGRGGVAFGSDVEPGACSVFRLFHRVMPSCFQG